MRTRLRGSAWKTKNKKKKKKERRAYVKHGNLVNCTHPPNTTNTKDAQSSISLRTDLGFCILNETRPVGDLFSVQNTQKRLAGKKKKVKFKHASPVCEVPWRQKMHRCQCQHTKCTVRLISVHERLRLTHWNAPEFYKATNWSQSRLTLGEGRLCSGQVASSLQGLQGNHSIQTLKTCTESFHNFTFLFI